MIECLKMSDLDPEAVQTTKRDSGKQPDPVRVEWLNASAPSVSAIDSHAHVFVRGLPLAPQRRHAPDYDATLDEYVGHLIRNNVSHAVLVQPSFLGTDNSFFLEISRRYPQRFRGVAMVDPTISDAQLESLASAGVVGIRLNLVGLPLPDLQSDGWPHLLARVNDLNWHVEVHREAIDLPFVVGALLAQGCTVVVDHFGRPNPDAGAADPGFDYLLSVAHTGKVWVKLSAAYRSVRGESGLLVGAALAQQLLKTFGSERLVWGSDWPHTQHRDVIDYADSARALQTWVPDEATRTAILTRSAQVLFHID
jgi:predicted TIM-barrel fold metal-dependent hydrolase